MQSARVRSMRITRSTVMAAVGALMLWAQTAPGDVARFIFDTTAGATGTYDGDLSAGVWSLQDIDGQEFRSQRIFYWVPPDVANGTFGAGPGPASFELTLHLVEFIDRPPLWGPDLAIFEGEGNGMDLVIVDEQGNRLEANVAAFELVDHSAGGIPPGYVGGGIVTDVVLSGDEFQGICARNLGSEGHVYVLIPVINDPPGDPVTLEEYLASGGLGGLEVEVDTIEYLVRYNHWWGDLDSDDDVDQDDLAFLLGWYGQLHDSAADLDGDGDTD
ncbi:MAG: hypothetical protein ACF8NJ_10815, partial [Phycisphaerales bacterium JB038]